MSRSLSIASVLLAGAMLTLSGCGVPTEEYSPQTQVTESPPPQEDTVWMTPQVTKPVVKKVATWSEGTYEVPADIKPGKYKTIGGVSCYFARLSSLNGTEDILDNNLSDGPMVIRVKKTDAAVEFSGPCKWRKAK